MKHLLSIVCLLLPPIFGLAQQRDTTASFTLKQAIEYAQLHQSSILNAQIDEQIASNTVKKTVGIGLPQVTGSANFQDFLKLPTSLLPGEIFGGAPGSQIPVQFGVKYQSSLALELNQLIFDGSYLVGLQASKTFKELSNKSLTRSKIEVAVAVTKAYYSVLVSQEQLTLIDANLIRLKKTLSDTEALFKNGFVEQIDVDRLNVLTNNLETEKENILRLLELNVNLLKFQMGMTIGSNLTLVDKINDLNKTETSVKLESNAYQNRIEYSLLETQKKLNELDLKRYKSLYLPSLSGFASTSGNFQDNSFRALFDRSYPSTIIGLRLNLPIFSGFQRLYQVRNAKLEVLKTQNDLSNLENAINLEVSQADISYKNGQKSLTNQQRNMQLAQEVLRVSKIKYEQGVGSSLEVTTAETALKEAQNNYITALYEMLINKVNLDKALGNFQY